MVTKTKYNIGDIVYLKHRGVENTRMFILEILVQQCNGGVQVHYLGRLYFDTGPEHRGAVSVATNLLKVREDELGKVISPKAAGEDAGTRRDSSVKKEARDSAR